MISNFKVSQKGMILVLVPVVFELFFVAVLAVILSGYADDYVRLERSRYILTRINALSLDFTRSIVTLADSDVSNQQKIDELNKIQSSMRGLETIPLDSINFPEFAEVREDASKIYRHLHDYSTMAKTVIVNDKQVPHKQALDDSFARVVQPLFPELHNLNEQVILIEKRIRAIEPAEIERFDAELITLFASGFLLSCILSYGLSQLFSKDIVRRIKRIENNAQLLASQAELLGKQEGTDEIAQLDSVLHETHTILSDARRKERAIVDNATDVICSIDEQLRIAGFGAASEKLWGYSQEQLRGLPLSLLISEQTRQETISFFQTLTVQSSYGRIENDVRCREGSVKRSLWTVNWLESEKRFYCVVHDVTELRAIEHLKQKFLLMVSHDLRAPLASASMSVSLISSGKTGHLSPGVSRLIQMAENSITRLSALANDLLELDRLESGKLQLDLQCVSASECCRTASELLETLAAGQSVSIKGPIGDAAVLADEHRLIQVITNLLSNAIKFSPMNSSIELAVSRQAQNVEIRITDQGPGIALADQSLIFGRFQQSDAVSNVAIKGTGLGLAIVKAIVEAHDGSVGIESEIGRGSTFWFRIPAFEDEEEDL